MDKGNSLSHLEIILIYINIVQIFYIIVGFGVRNLESNSAFISYKPQVSDNLSYLQIPICKGE